MPANHIRHGFPTLQEAEAHLNMLQNSDKYEIWEVRDLVHLRDLSPPLAYYITEKVHGQTL